jgi:hypothetical protein
MESKINWLKDSNGNFSKVERNFSAVIAVDSYGQAHLSITALPGASLPAPAPQTYTTIKNAKRGFVVFLRDVPVS